MVMTSWSKVSRADTREQNQYLHHTHREEQIKNNSGAEGVINAARIALVVQPNVLVRVWICSWPLVRAGSAHFRGEKLVRAHLLGPAWSVLVE